ncbi:tripartite tricarboxylate transporter substrate binding protein [Xylophilus sp. GOD-11R]|uniref:tripartite tricarboxylate transporter substrate binding protein n=1 Tax=Xylophilus sp. GOD-11R TaxID=3089814 RepID=UPI00298BD8F3|nr:tripartite tricarboxylate transporter substrate binding protein [Xylophilus sp. GOD-11R]WPB55313.1 tripartite tricarboxylate transporter substrate binding protein [Xylophilus sp. GOD-11R]
MKRRPIAISALAALAALATGAAPAQPVAPMAFPTKPVRLVVTYPPGGTVDAVARILGPKLSARWGQPVLVDNRAGGGGLIGGDLVVKAPADGYTLLFDASNHSQNPALKKSMPFDTLRDLQAVSLLVRVPNVVVVNPQFDAKSLKDLIALARARPGQVNYASSGNGSAQHLAGELFTSMTKTSMTHVAYRGGGPAMVDVMAGQVPVFFASLASSLPYIRSGKLTPLAVTGQRRSPVLAEVPTVAEAGVPGYEMYEWNGVFAPAGTPPAVVERISRDMAAVLADREVNARLIALGAEVIGSTPAELDRFRRAEITRWSQLARQARIELD